MPTKHRKGKGNHKHEENSFKHEALESEPRAGPQSLLLFILFSMIVIGGATVGWFCFQQHQSLAYLADNLMGMQMKMVKLQSFQEEMRKANEKLDPEGFESRLHALEESYALSQKQASQALSATEQLKTSDLPSQVLALHTEMKARLAEVQRASVSSEQLSETQAMLNEKNQELEAVGVQVKELASISAELGRSVDGLAESLAASEARLEEKEAVVGNLGAQLQGQASDLVELRDLLVSQQAQMERSTEDIAAVKALLESDQAQWSRHDIMEEQLDALQQSLQVQDSASQGLHTVLQAQLDAIQDQIPEPNADTLAQEPTEETAEDLLAPEEGEILKVAKDEMHTEEESATLEPTPPVEDVQDGELPPSEEEEPASTEEEGVTQEEVEPSELDETEEETVPSIEEGVAQEMEPVELSEPTTEELLQEEEEEELNQEVEQEDLENPAPEEVLEEEEVEEEQDLEEETPPEE